MRSRVVGMGYVGLPLAVAFAEAGLDVLGFDVDQSRVDELVAGRSYVGDVGSEQLAAIIASGRFRGTVDFDRVRDLDARSWSFLGSLKRRRPDIKIEKPLTPPMYRVR